MRKLTYIIGALLLTIVIVSCNEDKWLDEEPLDLRTAKNSYQTLGDFDAAVINMYSQFRDNFRRNTGYMVQDPFGFNYTDMGFRAGHSIADASSKGWNNFRAMCIPESKDIRDPWEDYYKLIYTANVIINRIEDVEFNDESERNNIIAQARFFRAWAYSRLGIHFGDVPIVLEEYTEPKRDFTRDPVEDIWNICISDLEYAVENLPAVTEVADGRLTKAAAGHLLTVLYIIIEDYVKAINTATAIIDDPNYSLMTERFGARKEIEPGDPYWDLFQRTNKNRQGGLNTESIWVAQYEYGVEGGGNLGWNMGPRFLLPSHRSLKDVNGVNLFQGIMAQYGGRGIGWMTTTDYMRNTVWERSGPNDLRNSGYSIIRDIVVTNPASDFYGDSIVKDGVIAHVVNPLGKMWAVIYAKTTPIGGDWPSYAFEDPEAGTLIQAFSSYDFSDHYIFRLAETYLLRAEAYLMSGNQAGAADDINIVRARVNADPVSPGNVDIDYILDERARELCWEKERIFTLKRMNKFIERVRQYNLIVAPVIDDHHSLFPIPHSEIERNTEAVLEQNPGY